MLLVPRLPAAIFAALVTSVCSREHTSSFSSQHKRPSGLDSSRSSPRLWLQEGTSGKQETAGGKVPNCGLIYHHKSEVWGWGGGVAVGQNHQAERENIKCGPPTVETV